MFFDDVGGVELLGEFLLIGVMRYCDDVFGVELFCGEYFE